MTQNRKHYHSHLHFVGNLAVLVVVFAVSPAVGSDTLEDVHDDQRDEKNNLIR